ncbi:MAG TPA: TerC family protein [Polyangiales bacterium]|nr:TerC family protein [Polyangiales bacterium]
MQEASIGSPLLWGGFILFVLLMLALDLGVFNRKDHVVGFREAAIWSGVWVGLSLAFNGILFWKFGRDHGIEFLTGYLIEKSLSIDNIFVFIVIFQAFAVPAQYQHRVLYWGILSALVMRAAMIFAGVAMLQRFHWLIYVFGVFLIITGVRLYLDRNKEEHPEESRVLAFVRRLVPSTNNFHGHDFFTVENGRHVATPMFMTLLLIEISDVIFAVDSIPAIFAVTTDPFIVFTSNIFAILGLRSLFFILAGLVERFRYLKVGLAVVLVFVGTKMAIMDFFKIPALVSLGVILATLAISVLASFWISKREAMQERSA